MNDLVAYRRDREQLVERVASAALPTKFGEFTVHGYRAHWRGAETEHAALTMGDLTGGDPTLVRVHSECLTVERVSTHAAGAAVGMDAPPRSNRHDTAMERQENHRRTVAVLCGGVGAARFLSGLVRAIAPTDVSAIVNVADDEVFHGLHVSPDLDTVLYTLAGMVDEERGWGIRGDSFMAHAALGRFGQDGWFQLGDADLATHIRRTEMLRAGDPLSAVTAELAGALGVKTRLLPATDGRQRTMVRTAAGWLRFQEYFVQRRAVDVVLEVRFDGVAAPGPGVLAALATAALIVIAPSNPIVSIGPLLALNGLREMLVKTDVPIVAISPIVGGAAIKGPAAEMLASLGHEVSPVGVARLYADFIDALVLDETDAALAPEVDRLGISAVVAPTIMRDAAARERLARLTLDAAGVT